MSPVQHPVNGPALEFSLREEMAIVRAELAKAPARIGRTLIKDGPLRVTLVGVRADHGMREHRTSGPLTIHVLDGTIEVDAAGKQWALDTGMILALDGGVVHEVTSADGGIFLLTVMHGDGDSAPVSHAPSTQT